MRAQDGDPPASQALGRLEPVDPLTMWRFEEREFTPWLLENADALGDVLDIDVELSEREHRVGPFELDLIGRDLTHDATLIVENQLPPTNHRHRRRACVRRVDASGRREGCGGDAPQATVSVTLSSESAFSGRGFPIPIRSPRRRAIRAY